MDIEKKELRKSQFIWLIKYLLVVIIIIFSVIIFKPMVSKYNQRQKEINFAVELVAVGRSDLVSVYFTSLINGNLKYEGDLKTFINLLMLNNKLKKSL